MIVLINLDRKHREATLEVAGYDEKDLSTIVRALADCAVDISNNTTVTVREESLLNDSEPESEE